MKTIQYTIRNVPADLDHYLRREARRLGVSLNKVAVDYLRVGTKGNIKIEELVKDLNEAPGEHWLDMFAARGTVDVTTRKILAEQAMLDKKRMKRGE